MACLPSAAISFTNELYTPVTSLVASAAVYFKLMFLLFNMVVDITHHFSRLTTQCFAPTHRKKSIGEGRCKFWLYMSPNYFSYIYVGSGGFRGWEGGWGAERAAVQGGRFWGVAEF